jgi:uncharacterized protein YfaT (DUF1175 family)
MRLTTRSDQEAFRGWFTWLAESQIDRPSPEVKDCSALLRFSYREALRAHDGAWCQESGLDQFPPFPDIRKYHYPHTPLGAALFRIDPGSGLAAFSQFANAQTLLRFNCYRLGAPVEASLPGDLLFYRQLDDFQPFHSMICLERKSVIYHTGPVGKSAGEIRRPALSELLNHPSPRWRPAPGNTNFLGVYRWNILRDST